MRVVENKRAAVISLHQAGQRPTDICIALQKLKVNPIFIYRTSKRYTETHSINDRSRPGRQRSARTKKIGANLKARIKRNPARSQRKLAKEMKVS